MSNANLDELRNGHVTADNNVTVTVDRNNPLAVGPHVVQLVVVDDAGNESQPVPLTVVVVDSDNPTAVPEIRTVQGRPIRPDANGNFQLPFGASFMLSGRRSTDPTGRVVEFRWTLLQ